MHFKTTHVFFHRSLISTIFFIVLTGFGTISFSLDTNCTRLHTPSAGIVLFSPQCTLSIESCQPIKSVLFFADSLLSGARENIGIISRPPFKLIWNMGHQPNHLASDFVMGAEITFKNGTQAVYRREGFYSAHHPVQQPSANALFSRTFKTKTEYRIPMQLSAPVPQVSGSAVILYNETSLRIIVTVTDPRINRNNPNSSKHNVHILIDPKQARLTNRNDKIFHYMLSPDKPITQLQFKSILRNDSLIVNETTSPVAFNARFDMSDFKGYRTDVTIPLANIGGRIPKTFNANIIASYLDAKGYLHYMSWTGNGLAEALCPYLWGTIQSLPPPVGSSLSRMMGIALGSGTFLGALIGFIVMARKNAFSRFEQSEFEEKLFHRVREYIDTNATDPMQDAAIVANQFSIPVQQINRSFKNNRGETMMSYLMRARIEIAKERLRSSRLSEKAIAETCGFENIEQMERLFGKYLKTTPYRFREEYQVK